MGPCENEKPQALGWNIRGLGTHRASYRRWPKPRASCTDGSSLAKKARELYAGRHVWRFLAKNPAPAVPWGRNLGIGVILELSFPSSECRCKGVYEPGTADPEEDPSKIAVRARFLANWRGRREACTSGDSIWKPCGVLGDATKETTGSCAGGRPNRERRGPLWFPSRASRRPYCSSEA